MINTIGSPSTGQLQVGIAIVLHDKFTHQAREASKEMKRLHQDAKQVTNANLSAVRSVATMVGAGALALSAGLGSAVRQGAEFVDTMTFVDAIATKNGITLDQLSQKARTLGRDTMWTSQDIASAMQYFAMAGMDTKDIYNNIEAAANLAGSTMSALGGKGGTADIMTNIMKMFRIESTQLNSARVADVLTKGVTSSNTSLYDLAEAVKYAGTTVTNLGGSLEQTAAFIGVLGNAGIQGSMAGTAIANTYRYLTKSIEDSNFKGNKALAKLGLSKKDFLDANGSLIDMGIAMQKIASATKGMPDTERFNTLVQILGVRGERGGSAMIKAFEDYSNLLRTLQNDSQGTASEIIASRMETIAGGLNKMTSAWENVVTTFTEAVSPTLTPIFNTFAQAFDILGKVLNSSWGPLISGAFTFGTVLITVRAASVALKATLKLMFNDTTVSIKNMMAVMRQGMNQNSLSLNQQKLLNTQVLTANNHTTAQMVSNANAVAAAYTRVSAAIAGTGATARATGALVAASGVGSVLMTKRSRYIPTSKPKIITTQTNHGPYTLPYNTQNQLYQQGRKQNRQRVVTPESRPRYGWAKSYSGVTPGGFIVSGRAALSPTQVTQQVVAQGIPGTQITGVASAPKAMAQGAAKAVTAGAITGAVTSGILRSGAIRGIGVALRGVVSFLGGPIGIGLQALIFFLPTIISALTGNNEALDENTKATAALNKHFTDSEPSRHMKDRVNPLTAEEQLIVMAKALETLSETLLNKPVGQVTINIDGKEAVQEILDSNQAEQAVNLGIK